MCTEILGVKQLIAELRGVSGERQWVALGRALGVSEGKLEEIQGTTTEIEHKKRAMIRLVCIYIM